jgi:hypothetical protein
MTTTAAPHLSFALAELRRALAHAEKRATETRGEDQWLHWAGQVDAYRHALYVLELP